MRWLRARVDARLAVYGMGSERINLLVANAAIASLPSLAEVAAGVNLTTVGSAEQRLGRGLEDDRAEMFSRDHGSLALPRTVAFLKSEDAVDGANEQLIHCTLSQSERLSSGGQTDKHKRLLSRIRR